MVRKCPRSRDLNTARGHNVLQYYEYCTTVDVNIIPRAGRRSLMMTLLSHFEQCYSYYSTVVHTSTWYLCTSNQYRTRTVRIIFDTGMHTKLVSSSAAA